MLELTYKTHDLSLLPFWNVFNVQVIITQVNLFNSSQQPVFNTSSVQRKGADYAARALKSMILGLGQIFQLFLKIWVMKVIAESMVKKLFVDFLGGKIGF